MWSSIMISERRRTFQNLLFTFTHTRNMGGGPRTFPGGVSKWKWKRMHEKRARDKERRLLDQEKQLYEARIRSHVRSNLSPPQPPPHHLSSSATAPTHGPMSPHDHVKALADRFMKEGAEDLWNNDDGPMTSSPTVTPPPLRGVTSTRHGSISSPVDLRKLIQDGSNSMNSNSAGNYRQTRGFSVVRNVTSKRVVPAGKRRFWRKDSDSDSGFESGGEECERDVKKMGSSAALGKYDVKRERRVIPKSYDEESDFKEKVELIKYELNKRKLEQSEGRKLEEETVLTQKRFDECGVSPLTVKALSAASYIHMTRVQEASLPICLEGKDVLVKAKTGTGKSAAFLLPAIETVLKAMSSKTSQRVPPILVLILCSTRELASQIAAEAKVLLKYHDGIGVQTLVGGVRFKVDQKRLESDPCQILVATPGRLLDHIENKSGISLRLMGLQMLVLDEADHLLDLGFRKDIEKIVDCLPRQRQSLLFSATMPKEVRRVSQLVLKREHTYVDTVGMGCVETPLKVKQSYLIAPHESHFQLVYHILKEHIMQTPDYKVIVFCITGMVTSLMYKLLREMKMNVREIHSRKPQIYRTRISDEFKESKQLILVSSDVSSRGMNYPDVTLVIQVGMPTDREQYIHRLGRTGREGKEGEGILLIAPWEEYFLHEIKDLPLEKFNLPDIDPQTNIKVEDSMAKIESDTKEAAYHSWLGYYNSIREIGREKSTVSDLANRFSESIGLQRPPALFRKTALKMGLKDIPGIRIRR
ncbi:putative RNA helicase [Lupinus albus]|uniref:ATP-dependent RNA helicase n=1 Tax=Lupinus albus TaxID=3870 RepID=A0A6A4QKL9_LUPAL|nr:putative RNA helicase [Lupinus albus]